VLERIRALDPMFAWPEAFRAPLQILVAGCGTGQQPLAIAAANPDAEVLGVDLSSASLAYAQRMAQELRIENIRFVQADLLHLPARGRKFHHVECVGVLHHLRDQQTAWKAVTSVLEPGGTLYVGVYGKLARLLVTHLRARIARENVPATTEGIRAFRAALLRESPSTTLAALRSSYAFYSVSMVRDMLFHVHEHQYALAELEERAEDCGLQFLGCHLPRQLRDPMALTYRPQSFAAWRTLETAYTGSTEMFVCTLRRPCSIAAR
jgi:ubiquinone/menaquinone biosynthesis C-methylase UbiE